MMSVSWKVDVARVISDASDFESLKASLLTLLSAGEDGPRATSGPDEVAKLPAGERLYPAGKRGTDNVTVGRKSGASGPTAPRSEKSKAEQSAGRLLPAGVQSKGKQPGNASVPGSKPERQSETVTTYRKQWSPLIPVGACLCRDC